MNRPYESDVSNIGMKRTFEPKRASAAVAEPRGTAGARQNKRSSVQAAVGEARAVAEALPKGDWNPPYKPSGDPDLNFDGSRNVSSRPPRKQSSRVRILETALWLFGAKGFADTSVRELAAQAEVNLAAVNYHFRSKENLWFEALRYGFSPTHITSQEMNVLLYIAKRDATVEAAEEALRKYIHLFVKQVIGQGSKHWAMFQRERLSPGPALEMVMRDFFEPMGSALGGILRLLLPDHPQDKINLCITSIIGQCVHIRLAAPTIKFFSGHDPTSAEFLEIAAIHIAEFSLNAVRGMRGPAAEIGTVASKES
jgi:TetR/AcrR family transcriptional regulator, regulator of cefoperazone and chloramphenicol sensitivity